MSLAEAFAPAKLNLFLHVGPVGPDGYHPVCSLMVFADVGDRVGAAPADRDSLNITGPFAEALGACDPGDNLVRRAADRFLQSAGFARQGLSLTLHKALPVAAGLGGGSSDAGAALRRLRDTLAPAMPDQMLLEIAAGLGADAPACLLARPVLGEGRGDRLSPAPELPVLHAVLLNPGVACPTGAVYRAFDEAGAPGEATRPALPDRFADVSALAAALRACRNDLEPAAIEVAPIIAEALGLLSAQPETRLARLSGSGATAFALVEGAAQADALAARLTRLRPAWWARACRLGGPWPDRPAGSP